MASASCDRSRQRTIIGIITVAQVVPHILSAVVRVNAIVPAVLLAHPVDCSLISVAQSELSLWGIEILRVIVVVVVSLEEGAAIVSRVSDLRDEAASVWIC